jgi:hypothetical protein
VDIDEVGGVLAPTDVADRESLLDVISHVHQIGWQLRLGEHIEATRQAEEAREVQRVETTSERASDRSSKLATQGSGGSQRGSHPPPSKGVQERSPFHRLADESQPGSVANIELPSWKACWGQPLTSSNLVSSATLRGATRPVFSLSARYVVGRRGRTHRGVVPSLGAAPLSFRLSCS